MSTNTTLRPVKISLEEEVSYYADALAKKETLKWVTLALAAALLLQTFENRQLSKAVLNQKPIVVRVNEVGRAEAVTAASNQYIPQDPEIRYFLQKFMTGFYSRNHRLTPRDYPESLAYLSPAKLAAVEEENRTSKWYAKFMNGPDDEIDVVVKNVGLDLSSKPYRAHVEYEKVFSTSGGTVNKREMWTCELAFVIDSLLATKNNEYVKVNPLAFQITDYRPEQAF